MVNFKFFSLKGALLCTLLSLVNLTAFSQQTHKPGYRLIAHRGGIVDNTAAENSREALDKAIKHGYWMVEVDLRLTKDNMLITHHDNTFKRSFGVDSTVSSMNWAQIKRLKSDQGYQVMSFEELLKRSKGRIGIMIDNKIRGNDTVLFGRVIELLKKYNLFENALMIGTDESTAFFTGKIKLSCTRSQLEENMRKASYRPSDFYLFSGNISSEDVKWTIENNILAVGVINAWGMKPSEIDTLASEKAKLLKASGLTHFQIDSIFEDLFRL